MNRYLNMPLLQRAVRDYALGRVTLPMTVADERRQLIRDSDEHIKDIERYLARNKVPSHSIRRLKQCAKEGRQRIVRLQKGNA